MHNFTDRQDIWEEAHEAGVNEGLERGIEQTIYTLVRSGALSAEAGAEHLGVTVDKLTDILSKEECVIS